MIADFIRDCTDRGDLVLDAFLGSGTSLLAAHQTGRVGVGIELEPRYVDLAVQRLADITGEVPHLADGTLFEDVQAQRLGETADCATLLLLPVSNSSRESIHYGGNLVG